MQDPGWHRKWLSFGAEALRHGSRRLDTGLEYRYFLSSYYYVLLLFLWGTFARALIY